MTSDAFTDEPKDAEEAEELQADPDLDQNIDSLRRPLTWEEARSSIRYVLENYMKTEPPVMHQNPKFNDSDKTWKMAFLLQRFDLDMFACALPACLAVLAFSCVSFSSIENKDDQQSPALNARSSLTVYRAQIAASVLFLSGSLLSIVLVRHRRKLCTKDSDENKRHCILKFLLAMDKPSSENRGGDSFHDERELFPGGEKVQSENENSMPGNTSLTDVYPVYRSGSDGSSEGSWQNIPTLLLCKGDYIALQVGDIAPSKCRMIEVKSGGRNSLDLSFTIAAGERVAVTSFDGDAQKKVFSSLPRGRSTLPSQSCELLTLCNNMRLFALQETPLESFLRLPQVQKRIPLIHRQIEAIRLALFLLAIGVFVLTLAIILVRPGIKDRDLSIILPLPFLAAISVLPVSTPVIGFFLEVLGTARILASIHPHAAIRNTTRGKYNNDKDQHMMLFMRYVGATASSRLSLQEHARRLRLFFRWCSQHKCQSSGENFSREDEFGIPAPGLVHVPPASVYLLEKLGVATAFALVDDELACEPHSIPQQLLIPSGKGLKLLDLCQGFDGESDSESDSERSVDLGRVRSRDSDSESDDEEQKYQHITTKPPKRKRLKALRLGSRRRSNRSDVVTSKQTSDKVAGEQEVQFEDPLWWQHLASLKCIGLACLVAEDKSTWENSWKTSFRRTSSFNSSTSGKMQTDILEEESLENDPRASSKQQRPKNARSTLVTFASEDLAVTETMKAVTTAEKELVTHIRAGKSRSQLKSLAACIGFSTEGNSYGQRGDLSPFRELLRLHVISTRLLNERLAIDTHELGMEQSRTWGALRPDSTSIVVQDRRSKGYQLLTIGDPTVVTELCQEAWQGENSTILPLSISDKRSIMDTSNNWSLADLDVAAFSYSPVPYTLEHRLGGVSKRSVSGGSVYLVDNIASPTDSHSAMSSEDWSLIKNQIFLGVLGSSVVPRKEIERLLDTFNDAGVRFVYFSPRNMRRTKELASQMGIDVAWNCAISLRPLDEGEEDPHRMTSTYADWDINAKLPHGIDDVRKHLKEVDNVPLLVSLFTDVTKVTTTEMIQTFQDYSDTVFTMGLSHLPRNANIFASSDLSVGSDVLIEGIASKKAWAVSSSSQQNEFVLPYEMVFVSSISAHSCAFVLRGACSTSLMPPIIARGRAALEAATSSALFVVSGSVSLSLYILLSTCIASTTIPFVPLVGSALYLQVVLPLVGLAMAMSDSDSESMNRVPPKNDQSVTFTRREGKRLYSNAFLKSLPPALLPQLLHYIALGELMISLEPEFVQTKCGTNTLDAGWVSLVRCDALKDYSGPARISAGCLVLAEMVLCVIVASTSFVNRTIPISKEIPWRRNHSWVSSIIGAIVLVAVYLALSLEDGTFSALPWYFFFLAVIMPFICLLCNEAVKMFDAKHEKRAVMLRRLQFETRLGMWSPK